MSMMRALVSVFLFAVLTLGVACGDDDGGTCTCPADEVINCGHRGTGINGADNPYPENTLPSFEQGVLEGADMIELDVHHSADGELVVIHDDEVDRTTDATGCVGDMTLAQLQALDAGFGTDMEGQGVTIPTLDEVLAAVDVPVNIEIKLNDNPGCPDGDPDLLAADVVDAIQADPAPRDIVVSSFSLETCQAVKALDPTIYVGYLSMLWSDGSVAADNGLDALNFFGEYSDAGEVQSILDHGVDANAWTIDSSAQMMVLIDSGVSMIITNDPDVLAQARQDYCADYCLND